MPRYILGINAYHGDAAAAIIRDGQIVTAVEEERFNRVKHCAGFPSQSIRFCLEAAGISIEDVDHVGISRDPSAHLHKKVLFAATRAARQLSMASARASSSVASVDSETKPDSNGNGSGMFRQIKNRLGNAAKVRDLKEDLARMFGVPSDRLKAQFHNVEHHRAHLASSFFVSPFERAALLSIDGFGDFISTMWAIGERNSIEVLGQVEYPHSTGIVYTATYTVSGISTLW
jgi:carbamoyltransferase